MPQTCTICRHLARDAIGAAVQHGTPLRTIADQYDVSKSALIRHKQHATIDRSGASWAVLAAEAQLLHERALEASDILRLVRTLRGVTHLLMQLCETGEANKVGQRQNGNTTPEQ